MTRYSRTNEVLQPNNIRGAGPHSFFERCQLVGDFSRQDWRDWTILNCDLTDVTHLPPVDKLIYIYSRNTDWPINGAIPVDAPLHNPDLAVALFRQMAIGETGRNKLVLETAADLQSQNYRYSIKNLYYLLKQQLGISYSDLNAIHQSIFSNHPRRIKAVNRAPQSDVIPVIPNEDMDDTAIRVLYGRSGVDRTVDISPYLLPEEKDRWELARRLERAFTEIRFWVRSSDPLIVHAMSRRNEMIDDSFWWHMLVPA